MKFAFLLACLLLAANAPTTPVNLAVGDGPDAKAEGTARLVGAIVEYTHWRESVGTAAMPIRLCVAGAADYAGGIGTWRPGGSITRRIYVSAKATDLVARCDAVYIGAMDLPAMRGITAQVRGAGILTIAEADPTCRSEAMFCLVYLPRALTFQLNIDAVSRSGLSVDPRVLRLSRGF